ncbi:glutamate 5-kinase [Thermocrinis albus DSM 14484]|uniref:Glutamate 5-kinase n=1 Tax=Thermocrinis albus (strain DSM 14484 / JCM 11386 / HI 11/12) TaxID=638303 RepID=D3SN59_THEAH|nr:glutamate 5-kinase [Thermocrinis albus]ADC90189.1 glutamate 5-kinase [Thermocrinis albus DSM 14484]
MRIVLKIGSNLIQTEDGDIDLTFLSKLAKEIKSLVQAEHELVIVSSGAVLCGLKKLGLTERPKELLEKQVLAGIGQAYLMHLYDMVFSNYGLVPAQVLLTSDVFRDKGKFYTVKGVVEKMLKMKVIPIINENDTVAVAELIFGDNDFLAVHTAFMLDADLLVFFSSAGGLRNHDDRVIPVIEDIDAAFQYVRSVRSSYGTGGMISKLTATRIALRLGIPVVITGKEDSLLDVKDKNTKGTYFKPYPKGLKPGKRWLAMIEEPKGALYIDEGAYAAIKKGKSLLPAGIQRVEGYFSRGDVVGVYTSDGVLVGKGRVNFSSEELKLILGKKGDEVKRVLKTTKEEAIHRDSLVVF